jgi:hypothetical protein
VLERLDSTTHWGLRCRIVQRCTVLVRAGHPRVPPAGVFAWRGEPEPYVSWRGSSSVGAVPRLCGATGPAPRASCVGPALVGDVNCSCELVVGGGNFLCERVVGGEAESPHARWKLVVRGGELSCEAETPRASPLLVGDEVSC